MARHRPQWLPADADLPGTGLAFAIGGLSLAIARLAPSSALLSDILVALLLGTLILNTPLRRLLGLALPSTSDDREPDRWAPGLRYTGKWVLRAAIVLMGLKVQTQFFGLGELALIGGVAAAAVPSAFFAAHTIAALAGVRRPMADLLASGTMICGASAVNAVAPVVGAHRSEQGIAIGTVFLFSVVALILFHPIALLFGLDPAHAGLWSGLAVNDLSSAIAVGKQMGGAGGVLAAASKSARILLLAPMILVFAVLRGTTAHGRGGLRKRALETVPRYLFGYIALALVRAAGDRAAGDSAAWQTLLEVDRFLVDLFLLTVAGAIGLHLELGKLFGKSLRALAVGGGASLWMASVTLAMIIAAARGAPSAAALIGVVALVASYAAYRGLAGGGTEKRQVAARFTGGAPLSLAEAMELLEAWEAAGEVVDDPTRRRLMHQLHPSIGELIPVRESPLPHGQGCRWITYWQGASGWALVAVCREPGATTPIHDHPHRMLGKSIEGVMEELRFREAPGELELVERRVLGHEELVETEGFGAVHAVRVVGARAAIDLQLRGPEQGGAGRKLRAKGDEVDLERMAVGARFAVVASEDDRPGHGGEGAGVGKIG